MTTKDWIIVAAITIAALVVFVNYGKAKYDEGFGVGCLIAFYWIEANTSSKDAIETYMLVTSEHPEDAIYICERTKNNKFKIKQGAKQFKIKKL